MGTISLHDIKGTLMRAYYVGLVLISGLLMSRDSLAATVVGPFQDLKKPIVGSNIYIELKTVLPLLWPPWTTDDKITIQIGPRGPGDPPPSAKGIAYQSYDNPDFTGNVVFTTIYGIDLDPTGAGLAATGFDSELAAAYSFSNEQFFGVSGAVYDGVSLGTPSLAELPLLLPGYDLSPFQGDPSSIVYVFQTTAPASDFIVPEGSSLVLFGLGALSLVAYSRCSQKRKQPSV
jgi:hypothetical protein